MAGVSLHPVEHFGNRHASPCRLDRSRRAYFGTLQAGVTVLPLNDPGVLHDGDCLLGAGFDALAAPDALDVPGNELRGRSQRLRVAAPPAAKWAAFEEHRRTDARPVVDGEALDVEYHTAGFGDVAPHVPFVCLHSCS